MSRKIQMADVVRAHIEVRGCPVLTSNQCHAIAMNLNCQIGSTPAYDEAKEREMFEAYALEILGPYFMKPEDCLTRSGGTYMYGQPATAWCAWQACAKSRDRSAE